MIEHLQMHPVGFVHSLTAAAALVFGTVVIFSRKGTRRHRWTGWGYLAAMLAMNGTALANYELYGRFGPFHWMAVISLVTVLAGYRSAVRKSRNWHFPHACFMVGSYVGLVPATVAEVASRVPDWSFGPSVIISSSLVIIVGLVMMWQLLPRIVRPYR